MGVDSFKDKKRFSSNPCHGPGGHHWAAKCKLDYSKEFEQKGIPLQESAAEKDSKDMEQLTQFFGMEEEELQKRLAGTLAFAATAFSSTVPARTASTGKVCPEAATLKVKNLLWAKVRNRRDTKAVEEEKAQQQAEAAMDQQEEVVERAVGSAPGRLAKQQAEAALDQQEVVVKKASLKPPERSRTYGFSLCQTFPLPEAQSMEEHSVTSMETADLPASARFGKSARERIHRPVTPRDLLDARPPAPLSIGDFPPIFQRNRDKPQESHYNYFSRRIPEERPELRKVMELRANNTRRLYTGRGSGSGGGLPSLDSEQPVCYTITEPCCASGSGSPRTPRGRSQTEPDSLLLPAFKSEESVVASTAATTPRPPSNRRQGGSFIREEMAAKKSSGGRRQDKSVLF